MEQAEFLGQKVVQASLDGREAVLARWFSEALKGAHAVEITRIGSPPPGSGFSAENYFLDVAWRERGSPRADRFVLRRVSSGRQMFPNRDFGHERQIQEVVGALDAARVPRIIGFSDDPSVLGAPFYVMSFIEGEVPPTNPSHHEVGVLADMPADQRRRLWLGALTDLGHLHRKTHNQPAIEAFAFDRDGRSAFTDALDYWRGHYDLGADGKPLALMQNV